MLRFLYMGDLHWFADDTCLDHIGFAGNAQRDTCGQYNNVTVIDKTRISGGLYGVVKQCI